MTPTPRSTSQASQRLRTLCARCLESFELHPDDGADPICPTCAARELDSDSTDDSGPSSRLAHQTPSSSSALDEIPGFWRRQCAEASEWCDGRLWWVRLPLWLYFGYVLGRHLIGSEPYRSVFDGLNLGIHELGHIIFRPFGQFMMVAGGTIAQCVVPTASLVIFHRQRDFFGISVGLCWLATSLWGIAIYVGDARSLELPLVGPGMGVMPAGEASLLHDWNHMLGVTGWLRYDTTIAMLFRVAAVSTMLVGLGLGAWLFWRMARSRRSLS